MKTITKTPAFKAHKPKASRAIYIGVVVLMFLPLFSLIQFAGPASAEAAVSDWQKGVSVYPHSPTDFDSDNFRQSIRNAKAAGANSVALIVPVYQNCDTCSDIFAGGDSPTDAALTSAINFVHAQGMKVMLKPHLGSYNGYWRATINANDRDAWFRNYGNFLNHLGDIGKQTGVEGMSIGAELINMSAYTVHSDATSRWQSLIGTLRTHFPGFLTYSANWGWNGDQWESEVFHIGFWGSLDYVGISAYYPIAQNVNNPSMADLTGSWDWWNKNQIQNFHTQNNKPVLFTEIGYASSDGAHNGPCCVQNQNPNMTEQANDYQALFTYWNGQPWMAGAYLWDWNTDPNYGGQGNGDYTPQHKPAEDVMRQWFGTGGGTTGGGTTGTTTTGGTGGGTTGGTSQVSGNWSASSNPPALTQGQAANVPVTLNISGSASHVNIDVEIYGSSGRVAQKIFEDQSLSSSQPGNYTISWTPPDNNSYTLKIGAFNNNWTSNYYWNDSVTQLKTGSTGGGGTTGTTTTGGTGGGTTGGTSQVSGNWSASSNAPSLTSGQAASVPVTVNISGSASNVIVDMEIFDSTGHQVTQKYMEGQNISPSQPGSYSISFTPSNNNPHTLKVGTFSKDWSSNYYWNDSVTTMRVGGTTGGGTTGGGTGGGTTGGGGTTSGPVVMDIWWPSDGSTIQGVQPFKGLVEGKTLSDYKMYWQVDSGPLVEMGNSQADYPHKESDVDVSPWNWQGNNQYHLTFVAKDNSGTVIAQKSITITVQH